MGIDMNEWLAVHIVQFFNELSLFCAIIRSDNVICNEESCPKMSLSSDHFEYLWHSKEFIQPISVSAPKYIDFLLEWIDEIINSQFPTTKKEKNNEYKFALDFKSLICKICRRIVRVFGHFYFAHYQQIIDLQLALYFNTSFQYFLYFIKEHKLVKDKELYPMRKIVRNLYQENDNDDGADDKNNHS